MAMDQVNKILLEKENVFVYKISHQISQNPKLLSRASKWDLSRPVKICKLILTGVGPSCHIQLDDHQGNTFAQSVIHWFPGINGRSSSLKSVLDSSRYFSLEVKKNYVKYYILGLGFSGHKDSLDLTNALENYFKFGNTIRELYQYRNELHQSQQGASKASTNDPKYICEKITPEQGLKERNEERKPSKFEQKLAEKCNISSTTAVKLNERICHLIEIQRKKRLTTFHPHKSNDESSGVFSYHRPGNIFQCHLCPAKFLNSIPGSPMPLTSHWKEVHQSKILSCRRCGLVFVSKDQFSLHMQLVHNYNCVVCHLLIGKIENVRRHLINNHSLTLLDILAKQTSNESLPRSELKEMEIRLSPYVEILIQKHREEKLKKIDHGLSLQLACGGVTYCLPDNSLQCHLCPARFLRCINGTAKLLLQHWRSAHRTKEVDCVKCNLVFLSSDLLVLHRQVFHQQFHCLFCVASVDKEKNFRHHLFFHHREKLLELEAENTNNTVEIDAINKNVKNIKEDNNVCGEIETKKFGAYEGHDDDSFEKKLDRMRGPKKRSVTVDAGDGEIMEPAYKVLK